MEKLELLRMKTKDAVKVAKYLEPTEAVLPPMTEFKELIRKGLGIVCRDKVSRKFKGVILTYQTEKRNVIAYFHVTEELRRKPIVGKMMWAVVKNFDVSKDIMLSADDVSMYKNHVEPVSDGVYKWTGDFKLWEKL